jgi:molecular chaperone HscB
MLLDPIARAEYILDRNGHALGETDRLDDEEFLAHTMEQRFAVEEAESQEEADDIKSNNQGNSTCGPFSSYAHLLTPEKLDEIIPSLSAAIRAGHWAEAKELTIRLKYLRNIIRAAETWPETSSDH